MKPNYLVVLNWSSLSFYEFLPQFPIDFLTIMSQAQEKRML